MSAAFRSAAASGSPVTTTALASSRFVRGVMWRLRARQTTWPAAERAAALPGGIGEPRMAFVVEYYARSESGLVPMRPMEVPDAQSAAMCVDAMPAPVARALAYRVDRRRCGGETRKVIASRDRRDET